MMKKNDELTAEITDLSEDGAGIGKVDGFIWFIKDALPGDTVRAVVTKVSKRYGFARVLEVLEPSPARVPARCAAARSCGGCQLQELSYAEQLRFKENKIISRLTHIGGFSEEKLQMEPIMGMKEPWRYRNKAAYPIGTDKNGKPVAGFYAGRTHHIIDCRDCMLGQEKNRQILDLILAHMERLHIAPYDEQSGKGLVRHVLIREGIHTGQLMVCLVINGKSLPGAEALCARLQKRFPELTSLSLSVNTEKSNVIMGKKLIQILGPGYIEDKIFLQDGQEGGSVRFRISPLSFFQVNSRQVGQLYGTAYAFADPGPNDVIWDLYCGVGTISLFMARHGAQVYGVEIVPEAIANAKENAELNGIRNAHFFVSAAEDIVMEDTVTEDAVAEAAVTEGGSGDAGSAGPAAVSLPRPDIVVVDPPRKGCDEACLQTILRAAPRKIVYVSCDPATLARDLRILCGNGYRLERIRPCDMFPHTVHIETIVLLQKLNS